MLRLFVGEEGFNETTNEFVVIDPIALDFEHSLVSLSKWESEFNRPFLSLKSYTNDEIWGYIRAMLVTPNVPEEVLQKLTAHDLDQIQHYVDSTQSATTFSVVPDSGKSRSEIVTAELIYYWMVAFNIPFECENWHLNRLFALIRISSIKNSKPTKQDSHQAKLDRAKLNAERRERLGTRG